MALNPQVFGSSWSDGSLDSFSDRNQYTGNVSINLDFVLPTGTVTNEEHVFAVDVDTIQGILISVTGNPATTVVMKTNSSGSPIHTVTFPAGGSKLFWTKDSPVDNPLHALSATDITTSFWTKSGVDTPEVSIRILYN